MNTRNENLLAPVTGISYIYKEEVSAIASGSDASHKTITLVGGASWKTIYFTKPAGFRESSSKTKSGTLYAQKVTGTAPGSDEDNTETIRALEGRPCVFKIDFKNNPSKLIGTKDLHAFISFNLQQEQAAGRSFEISCRMPFPAPWINGT